MPSALPQPEAQELSDRFSKYTTYPADFCPSTVTEPSITVDSGEVSVYAASEAPARLQEKIGTLFTPDHDQATARHAALAPVYVIAIQGDAQLTITKGTAHYVLVAEGGTVDVQWLPQELTQESTSVEGFFTDCQVRCIDYADAAHHCLHDRTLSLARSSVEQITVYANTGTTVGRTNLVLHEGATAHDLTLMLGREDAWYDIDARLTHRAPHTGGTILGKNVMRESSQAVLWGMIDIAQGAHSVESYQSAHSILYDTAARSKIIPQLEIANDDVTATHGATVGEIDENMLFYMQSKGIPPAEAKKMLCLGFLEAPVREHPFREQLLERLQAAWLR